MVIKFLVQAIQNQRNLQPKYYKITSYVGAIGCAIGLAFFSWQFENLFAVLNLDTNVPLRQMTSGVVFTGLVVMIVSFAFAIYFGAVLVASIFSFVAVLSGWFNVKQAFDYVFLFKYPESWYKNA
ncbi:hypothetical protein [Shewanella violacea]|uniref:hypothetical protein n=1 Tax=Shewanella violacea TaxID=60217 RepID=UPI00059D4137|nr:hypothetical protein [Shewanella violacea]